MVLPRLVIVLLGLALGAQAAAAAGARERCLTEGQIDIDMRISACNAFLEIADVPEDDQGVAFAHRGRAYLDKQNYGLALDDYEHADALRPDDAAVLGGRCRARAVLKRDLDAALADCNRALEIQPNAAHILGYRALVYLRLELAETAVTDYSAALQAEPKNAEFLYGRGEARIRNGDVEGGKDDIAAARAINPKVGEEFAKLERDDSSWSWAAMLEYWRAVMKALY